MNPRLIILVLGGLIAVGSAVTIWIAVQPGSPPASGRAVEGSVAPSDAQRREQAERFLGGNPNLDVRGGQEMRPRW